MGEATIDYDLECYTNQLKYKLENAIYAASNVSDLPAPESPIKTIFFLFPFLSRIDTPAPWIGSLLELIILILCVVNMIFFI